MHPQERKKQTVDQAVDLFSMTRSAPWTPLPRRFGAYSDKSTWRSHSITLRKKSEARGGGEGTRSGDLRHLSGGHGALVGQIAQLGRCR